jgi:acyl carrier protein
MDAADEGLSRDRSLNPTERIVAELWLETLQMDHLPDLNDDFFALGGDSMAMIMVELCIQEELSVEFPAGSLLNAPTLEEFSALVDSRR